MHNTTQNQLEPSPSFSSYSNCKHIELFWHIDFSDFSDHLNLILIELLIFAVRVVFQLSSSTDSGTREALSCSTLGHQSSTIGNGVIYLFKLLN